MANVQTWGFMDLEDAYDRRIADVEPERIDTALRESARAFNRDMEAMEDTLAVRTTQRDGAFRLPTSGELQPGSEFGTPRTTKGYREITQGYPMWRGMDSFGFTREAYAKLRVGELDIAQSNVEAKAARWKTRRMLAPIFTNVAWTFEEEGRTDLTVRPLAITGDGSVYLDYGGNSVAAEHYTGQADAISNTADPFAANSAILRAHPSNSGTLVHYIPSGLMASAMALEGFYPYRPNDGLVQFGGFTDVASETVAQYLGFGKEILGVVGDGVIVHSPLLPANYVVSVVVGGEKVLVMREEPEAELQGLQVVPIQVDSVYRRWDFFIKAGYAVRNPLGAAVRRISNGTYAIPSGFDARTLKG